MAPVSLIAAITKDRGLGKAGQLLYRIPDDLKHFKELTSGCPVIMGRKTYESIGRPLPNRTNIVVTNNPEFACDGCVISHDLESALSQARFRNPREVFVIGGEKIYEAALPMAQRLYLTLIDAQKEADAHFPAYDEFKKVVADEPHVYENIPYRFVTLER